MKEDLASRLRRLGLHKGPSALREQTPRQRNRLDVVLPGRLLEREGTACLVAEQQYPLDFVHGIHRLDSLLDLSTAVAGEVGGDPSLSRLSFRQFLFLDTETTGLSAGTGTIAFLVGIGYFDGAGFTVRQYFLRSPGDELAMLSDLAEQLTTRPGIVSFNGRSFDLPLLDNRFILNRMRPRFDAAPHLDLLHPARRLWRDTLASCRLIALEQDVLAIRRDQADVPGGVIPLIYRDYLRTGNAIEMPRIFYHNRIDVLSMVSLTTQLLLSFERPEAVQLDGSTWLSLAKWYRRLGSDARSEAAYRRALQAGSELTGQLYQEALFQLGSLLKRGERRSDAFVVWQQLASVEMDDVRGHVELAKHLEWHEKDLVAAADWTRRALKLVDRWPIGLQRLARPELDHRLARLERKLDGQGPPD